MLCPHILYCYKNNVFLTTKKARIEMVRAMYCMAENMGLEPTGLLHLTPFPGELLSHSVNSPNHFGRLYQPKYMITQVAFFNNTLYAVYNSFFHVMGFYNLIMSNLLFSQSAKSFRNFYTRCFKYHIDVFKTVIRGF